MTILDPWLDLPDSDFEQIGVSSDNADNNEDPGRPSSPCLFVCT